MYISARCVITGNYSAGAGLGLRLRSGFGDGERERERERGGGDLELSPSLPRAGAGDLRGLTLLPRFSGDGDRRGGGVRERDRERDRLGERE